MIDYSKPITSKTAAVRFIYDLHNCGKAFHFDDNPHDVIDENRKPLFTHDEAVNVSARVGELFKILDDPFEIALEALDSDD